MQKWVNLAWMFYSYTRAKCNEWNASRANRRRCWRNHNNFSSFCFCLSFFFGFSVFWLNNRNNCNCQDNLRNILKGASCRDWHSNLAWSQLSSGQLYLAKYFHLASLSKCEIDWLSDWLTDWVTDRVSRCGAFCILAWSWNRLSSPQSH